ncbi:glycosyltransferase [Pseudarthrobacter albicanus]|uniref:glycosyltransferase n=1 Tax=Pseudarthrobacter albicanus TaxID=2823873 RepID=UPI001BAD015C|nr:glycosyltransferase [Pseudarthrobacter albicanus]
MKQQIDETYRPPRARRKSVGFQAIALAASTGTAQLVVALLYIWSARSAGPESFGVLVASIGIGTAAVGFLDFGTNSYWSREVAIGRMSLDLLGRRIASKIVFAAMLATAWVLICLWFIPGTFLWIASPIAFSSLLNQSFQVSLRGIARGDLVSFSILSDRLVALLAFGAMVLGGVSIIDCLWLSLTLGSLWAAVSGWLLTPAGARPLLRLDLTTNPWKSAGHYGLANVAFSAQSLDTPIMTVFGGPTAAGIYAAVARWTQPMGMLANAFSSAAAPHMARATTGVEAWHHVKRSIWLPAAAILACLCIAVASPILVLLLIGGAYGDSAAVLQILALGTIPAIANQPLFVFLQARGLDKPVSFLAMINVVVQLGLVAILSAYMGAIGAALAAAVSQLVMLVGLITIVAVNRHGIAKRGKVSRQPARAREIRVVQVLLSPRIGGAEALVASLNTCWQDSAVRSSTVYLDETTSAPRGRFERIIRLALELRKRRPDVILAHSAIPNIYARIAAPPRTPVVTVLHSAGDDFKGVKMRFVEWLLSARTACVVAVSQGQRERYGEHFPRAKRIVVIPNGIRSDIRTRTKASKHLKSMATIARVATQKNPVLWTEVASRLSQQGSTLEMTWWGPVTSEPGLQTLVESFRSTRSAGRFAGPTDDPGTVLEMSDALFHPADREAHSIGILEAAAAGLPILCSTAVAATLPSNIVALPFEKGNAESALRSINELGDRWSDLSNQAISAAIGVKEMFSIKNCADEYVKLIHEVLRH